VSAQTLQVNTPDGVRLAVSVTGSGPMLLMIPGLGWSRRGYDPLVPLLARSCAVAVYDPRGIGDSDISDGPLTMSQLAADAAAVIAGMGEERAAVWGASMGGMVAQHVALDHGERVSALVLACTGAGGTCTVRAAPEATRALLGKGAKTPGEAYRLAATVMYTPGFRAAHAEFIEEQIRLRDLHPLRGRVFLQQYEAVRQHDVCERLDSIHMPTLVLHGTNDMVMPVGNGMNIAARIPGARLRLFEGGGHLFFHEEAEETARAVLEFLA